METFTHSEVGSLKKTTENEANQKEGLSTSHKIEKILDSFSEKLESIKNAPYGILFGRFWQLDQSGSKSK